MTLKIEPASGLDLALQGLKRAENQLAKAATDINTSFVNAQNAAQNAMAADSVSVSDTAALAPAVEDAVRGAVLATDGPDLSAAIVALLQARTAYAASAKTATVVADVESDAARLLGKTR